MLKKLVITSVIKSALALSAFATPAIIFSAYAADKVETQTNVLQQDAAIKSELQLKLTAVKGFSSSFEQQVIDADGNHIQTATGKLAVKRPNLIYWETLAPDETLVVSDGKTLWFYNPFVEQVSAFNAENAVTNTPILLLSGLADEQWAQYQVKKSNPDEFTIVSLDQDAQVKKLHLKFVQQDLVQFTVEDVTGQLSHFNLENIESNTLPSDDLFKFDLPEGVDFDDQR
ncbi:outer membrane lipoprotein chaperone LolA [Thalassotalea crassostreae]|uniref:outer membrane lipoprotein chaperone LolA n=1 Tax=Thalassotalea crassostreae TaxID=1763536 RepID=UPI0009EF01E9|nr:outer membrane lipoprotein chaperone LolA [Thalassotalea crassostreae]